MKAGILQEKTGGRVDILGGVYLIEFIKGDNVLLFI